MYSRLLKSNKIYIKISENPSNCDAGKVDSPLWRLCGVWETNASLDSYYSSSPFLLLFLVSISLLKKKHSKDETSFASALPLDKIRTYVRT